MTIPRSHPRWADLVEGRVSHQFEAMSASLMLNRLKREWAKDPTPANRDKLVGDAYTFFSKFEALFAADLQAIFK